MSSRQRKTAKHRRPIPIRQQTENAVYWPDELEKRLNRFGASTCDLPEIDPDSCQTDKQHGHAVRVRARFLARQIDEIGQSSEGGVAERLFRDLMTRAELFDDGPAWFVIEKHEQAKRSRDKRLNEATGWKLADLRSVERNGDG